MYSDKQIEELLFGAESSPELFNYKIQGFPIYSVLRFTIEVYIRNVKAESSVNKSTPLDSKFEKTGLTRRIINKAKSVFSVNHKQSVNLSAYDTTDSIRPSKVLFVSTSDLVDKDGYSTELIDELTYFKTKGHPVNFVIPTYNTNQKRHPLYNYYGAIVKNDSRILNDNDRQSLIEFLNYLSQVLSIDFTSQVNQWSYTICFFLNYSDQLEKYIQKSECSYVICRSAYTEPWVAMACSRANVKLIEVQHGVVKPDHVYYNSINALNSKKLLLPDYILTLGDEWRDILINQKFIYNSSNVFVLGTRDFDDIELQNKAKSTQLKKIVIALPPEKYPLLSISEFILEFFSEFGKKLEKIQIELRPHPIDGVQSLEKFKPFLSENVKISNPAVENFKELMLGCNILISVTSMCLYEALSYGKTVISFEKFKEQTINKGIVYVKDAGELYNSVVHSSENNPCKIKYLSPINLSVLDKFYN